MWKKQEIDYFGLDSSRKVKSIPSQTLRMLACTCVCCLCVGSVVLVLILLRIQCVCVSQLLIPWWYVLQTPAGRVWMLWITSFAFVLSTGLRTWCSHVSACGCWWVSRCPCGGTRKPGAAPPVTGRCWRLTSCCCWDWSCPSPGLQRGWSPAEDTVTVKVHHGTQSIWIWDCVSAAGS